MAFEPQANARANFRSVPPSTLVLCLIGLTAFSVSGPLRAAPWSNLGPQGAEITALVALPGSSVVLAGTKYGGVFKSTNGGASWSPSNAGLGLGAPWVQTLAVDPQNSSIVYAGLLTSSATPTLYKSVDQGATWSDSSSGLNIHGYYDFVYTVAIDPTDSSVAYLGSTSNIYRSGDSGASWSPIQDFGSSALAIDPSNPSTMYASRPGGCSGLSKSTDGGATWTPLSTSPDSAVTAIVVDPTDSSIVYVAGGCSAGGIWESTDGGNTWTQVLGNAAFALAMAPDDHKTLYTGGVVGSGLGGIFKTIGDGWSGPYGPTDFSVFAVAALPSGVAYAGGYGADQSFFSEGGALKSTDYGFSWTPSNTGLTNTFVNSVSIDPSNPAVLYAALNGDNSSTRGVSKSTDGGATWTPINQGLVSPNGGLDTVFYVVIDPTDSNTLFAAGASTFRSSNGGATWDEIDNGFPGVTNTDAIVIDSVTSTTLYAAVSNGGVGVYKSENSGGFWTQTGLTSPTEAIAIDPNPPYALYASSGGPLKSLDGGQTWDPLSGYTGSNIRAILITPVTSTIYAGTDGQGVFKSTDGGASWTQVASGLTNLYVKSLAVDSADENTIYAGTDANVFESGAVFQSNDGGVHWSAVAGLPPDFVYGLTVGPASSHVLYAATQGSGVQSIPIVASAPATLTVTKAGPKTGTVASTPAGINCGATCSASFAGGSSVTLMPVPGVNAVFGGWSGDPGCLDGVVVMSADKTCTATFNTRLDLVISALGAPGSAAVGATITVTDTTKNNSGGPAFPGTSNTKFWLSTNSVLDGGDTLLGARAIPSLNPGGTSAGSTSVVIPATAAPGRYFIIAQADGDATVPETNEANNTRTKAITIKGPDLTVSTLTAPGTSGAGMAISVTDTTKDGATSGPAPASTTSFYLSTDNVLDAGDTLLNTRPVPALAAGASNSATTPLTIPAGTLGGTYFLIAKADGPGVVPESNENNNIRSKSIKVGPDLTVSALTASATAHAGQTITVKPTTKNAGAGSTEVSTTTKIYLRPPAGADVLLGMRSVPILAPGTTDAGNVSVTIPANTPVGNGYFIIAVADDGNAVQETNEANNTKTKAITIN